MSPDEFGQMAEGHQQLTSQVVFATCEVWVIVSFLQLCMSDRYDIGFL